jgi:hypothetical protein
MSAEDTIRTILSNNSIEWYPLVAPHDADAPFVVYQEIPSNLNLRTHQGDVAQRSRWQLACWAYTYDEAKQLADSVKSLFHLNLINFKFAAVERKFDLPDPDSELSRKILEVFLWE